MKEPIFSRQEQGVVYLFSRYWNEIDLFKNKRIFDIHTHFPDFTMEDIGTGKLEGLEFEYGLSNFRSHLFGDLKRLKEDNIKVLYIVYWDEDYDQKDLYGSIKKHFKGKVIFVCLNNYFSPFVEADSDCLSASWMFSHDKQIKETYSFKTIEKTTNRLMIQGAFECLYPDKKLYRTVGFNKDRSDFIECDHWKTIHFFTTNRFQEDKIPSKLFVKPNGYQCFAGYFDMKYAFFINNGGKDLEEYFKNYYFYPYHRDYKNSTCFVYSAFKELSYQQGVALYKYLKKTRYALQRSSEVILDDEHIMQIDKIIR